MPTFAWFREDSTLILHHPPLEQHFLLHSYFLQRLLRHSCSSTVRTAKSFQGCSHSSLVVGSRDVHSYRYYCEYLFDFSRPPSGRDIPFALDLCHLAPEKRFGEGIIQPAAPYRPHSCHLWRTRVALPNFWTVAWLGCPRLDFC